MKITVRLKTFPDHEGIPGHVGGSLPRDESSNPYKTPYTEQQLHDVIQDGTRLKVKDKELGERTVLIRKVVDDSSYSGGKRVFWSMVNHSSPTGFDEYAQSITSLVEYLLDSKAMKHSGSGA